VELASRAAGSVSARAAEQQRYLVDFVAEARSKARAPKQVDAAG
jgi:hypothetical protein